METTAQKRARTASYPLRRVCGTQDFPLGTQGAQGVKEVLECGHALFPKADAFGRTFPAQRRCWKCARGLPADVKAQVTSP